MEGEAPSLYIERYYETLSYPVVVAHALRVVFDRLSGVLDEPSGHAKALLSLAALEALVHPYLSDKARETLAGLLAEAERARVNGDKRGSLALMLQALREITVELDRRGMLLRRDRLPTGSYTPPEPEPGEVAAGGPDTGPED